MHVISHDPFARCELVRTTVERDNYLCDWCGSPRTRKGEEVYRLFRYGTRHDDGGPVNWHKGAFCSKGCHDSYQN